MSIEQLGSLGEFIASIAVIVSLMVLAYQVRENTRQLKSASRERNRDETHKVWSHIIDHPDLAEIMADTELTQADLSPADRLRMNFLALDWFTMLQMSCLRGIESNDEYLKESALYALRYLRDRPLMESYWQQQSAIMRPEFQEAAKRMK